MAIPGGRGVSKAQFFEGKYGTKIEFPEGLGDSSKKNPFHGRGMNIFWNNTFTSEQPAGEIFKFPPLVTHKITFWSANYYSLQCR